MRSNTSPTARFWNQCSNLPRVSRCCPTTFQLSFAIAIWNTLLARSTATVVACISESSRRRPIPIPMSTGIAYLAMKRRGSPSHQSTGPPASCACLRPVIFNVRRHPHMPTQEEILRFVEEQASPGRRVEFSSDLLPSVAGRFAATGEQQSRVFRIPLRQILVSPILADKIGRQKF